MQSHRIPLYLRAWHLLRPASGSFPRPPISRCTIHGAKWTSRGAETSKITQRWELSVLVQTQASVSPSFLLAVYRGRQCGYRQLSWPKCVILMHSTAVPRLEDMDKQQKPRSTLTSCFGCHKALHKARASPPANISKSQGTTAFWSLPRLARNALHCQVPPRNRRVGDIIYQKELASGQLFPVSASEGKCSDRYSHFTPLHFPLHLSDPWLWLYFLKM